MPKKLAKLLNRKYFDKFDDYYDAKEALINDLNKILVADGDAGVVCALEVKNCLEASVDLYNSIKPPEDTSNNL